MIDNYKNPDTIFTFALMDEWNIGVDIVEIARFQHLPYKSNNKFYTRVFTSNEIKYCLSFNNPESHFATNFAGKEAVYKAVNMFYNIKLNNIEILRDEKGLPIVKLHLRNQRNIGTLIVKVSLSHSLSHAIAFAIAYKLTKSANKNQKAEEESTHEF